MSKMMGSRVAIQVFCTFCNSSVLTKPVKKTSCQQSTQRAAYINKQQETMKQQPNTIIKLQKVMIKTKKVMPKVIQKARWIVAILRRNTQHKPAKCLRNKSNKCCAPNENQLGCGFSLGTIVVRGLEKIHFDQLTKICLSHLNIMFEIHMTVLTNYSTILV